MTLTRPKRWMASSQARSLFARVSVGAVGQTGGYRVASTLVW
jgi:hypothetical protein